MTTPASLFEHAAATAPATILLGLDGKDRRHASWFNANETERALGAAGLMGMATLTVTSPELVALAGDLPHGKIFGSGKAFVPFVKQTLFDKLAAHLPDRSVLTDLRAIASSTEVAVAPAGKSKNYRLPKDWSKFEVNDLVLATEGGEQDGWYECVVVDAKDQKALTLQWRDWQQEPTFVRPAEEVALMWTSGNTAAPN
ncbi:hypothetical protein ABIB57_004640 [Devosia sp. UYZn731]|uniref:hypothetical protein n=1 Tax=Devosia sp. UYZn731 TaxID=3156345 RepID=UPI003396022A